MIPATTPSDLLDIAEALAERGARGFLLSGGSDEAGRIRIGDFTDAIREIKATTDLKINAHIGLANSKEIQHLVGCGIDTFSVDVYGSDETIREVHGLDARVEDYVKVVADLKGCGARVAPHVCVGIHGGAMRGEMAAIERLRRLEPETLVLISLIPTKGTLYESVSPPSSEMIESVVRKAREELPTTRLLLGCMRSKLDRSAEFRLVAMGLDGIVLPSSSTVDRLREEGYAVKKRSVCCAIP
jgi:uncharacterized radical SAM superfamily protein